jgi:hypothetical protein
MASMLVDAPGPRVVEGQDRLPRTRGGGPRLSLAGLGSQRTMTAMFALSSTQSGRFTSGHRGDSYRDALLVPNSVGRALGRR